MTVGEKEHKMVALVFNDNGQLAFRVSFLLTCPLYGKTALERTESAKLLVVRDQRFANLFHCVSWRHENYHEGYSSKGTRK